jgi:hypothetical protein
MARSFWACYLTEVGESMEYLNEVRFTGTEWDVVLRERGESRCRSLSAVPKEGAGFSLTTLKSAMQAGDVTYIYFIRHHL